MKYFAASTTLSWINKFVYRSLTYVHNAQFCLPWKSKLFLNIYSPFVWYTKYFHFWLYPHKRANGVKIINVWKFIFLIEYLFKSIENVYAHNVKEMVIICVINYVLSMTLKMIQNGSIKVIFEFNFPSIQSCEIKRIFEDGKFMSLNLSFDEEKFRLVLFSMKCKI